MLNGYIVGYDPGGNASHGVARVAVEGGRAVSGEAATCRTLDCAIEWITSRNGTIGLGVDTLTVWSTGPGGWRPADRYLRNEYPAVRNSIISPNRLGGSMVANGMGLMIALRKRWRSLVISETHPKVLYYALTRRRYGFDDANERTRMKRVLSHRLGFQIEANDEHQWDALLSAHAALQGMLGAWSQDLHQLQPDAGERLIRPTGHSHFYWP